MWFYFVAQIISSLAIGSFLSCFLCSSDIPSSLWIFIYEWISSSLLSGTTGCFRHILHIFCPSSRISRLSHFHKEGLVGSLSLSLWHWNQELGAWCAFCSLGTTASRQSQMTEQYNILTCVCVYIYIFLFLTICVYINLNKGLSWCL